MVAATIPENEQERLLELYSYDILNTQYKEDFNEIVELASEICNVPISLITLIDANQQIFKAKFGLSHPDSTDRNVSFCSHAILDDRLFTVNDATQDDRFFDNPLVTDHPNIRFYAGMPLINKNGFKLGTLCVIDTVPRNLDTQQSKALKTLAKQVIKLFELRLRNKEIEAQSLLLNQQKTRLEELNAIQNKIISIISHDIRSPLTSLKQVIELKDLKMLNETQANNFMITINQQVSSTINMLSNLVDWSSILMNKTDIDKKPILLSSVVETIFKNLAISTLIKNNKLINEIPKSLSIIGDENIIEFILRNLISNASKFTANGSIKVSTHFISDTRLVVSVADSGTGMSEDVLNKLYNGGKNNSLPGTNNEKGSGVGLMLVRDFILKIGSELKIESLLGKGTTVSFELEYQL